jgi:hypothetical protein
MSDEKQKSKKRKLKEIEEEKIEEDDLIDEKCPVMRDLCKSKVNWVLFRKRIFQRLRNDVKKSKTENWPNHSTGWITITDDEYYDPRFNDFIKELKDNGWEVNVDNCGSQENPTILGINWKLIY